MDWEMPLNRLFHIHQCWIKKIKHPHCARRGVEDLRSSAKYHLLVASTTAIPKLFIPQNSEQICEKKIFKFR